MTSFPSRLCGEVDVEQVHFSLSQKKQPRSLGSLHSVRRHIQELAPTVLASADIVESEEF